MKLRLAYFTGPLLCVVFIVLLVEFIIEGQIYCWLACLQPEISCLTTVSYTFGLVPATVLATSSALSGCLASFDMCELSCAKRSRLLAHSPRKDISDSCVIYRNGTKVKATEIQSNWKLANPFNLDADCNRRPAPTTSTAPPPPFTPLSKMRYPIKTPDQNSTTSTTSTTPAPNVSPIFKYPIFKNLSTPNK